MLIAGSALLFGPALLPAQGRPGDPVQGKAVYVRCIGCHSFDRHRTGPKHCALFGRQAGTSEGFRYSKAMTDSTIIWSFETLDQFLKAPLNTIPGTSMGFAGVKSDNARHDLIAYMQSVNQASGQCN